MTQDRVRAAEMLAELMVSAGLKRAEMSRLTAKARSMIIFTLASLALCASYLTKNPRWVVFILFAPVLGIMIEVVIESFANAPQRRFAELMRTQDMARKVFRMDIGEDLKSCDFTRRIGTAGLDTQHRIPHEDYVQFACVVMDGQVWPRRVASP